MYDNYTVCTSNGGVIVSQNNFADHAFRARNTAHVAANIMAMEFITPATYNTFANVAQGL